MPCIPDLDIVKDNHSSLFLTEERKLPVMHCFPFFLKYRKTYSAHLYEHLVFKQSLHS